MSETLNLFEQPDLEEHWTPPPPQPAMAEVATVDGDFSHFYARYGLAAALVQSNLPLDDLSETTVATALLKVVQDARDGFRMQPNGEPMAGTQVTFQLLSEKQLESALKAIPSGKKKPDVGLYMPPYLLSSDFRSNDLWNSLKNWDDALNKWLKAKGKGNPKTPLLSKAICPVAGDVNTGHKPEKEPKKPNKWEFWDDAKLPRIDFLERAICLATTLTPLKPAAYSRVPGKNTGDSTNTAILPDLSLEELHYFIGFFEAMQLKAMNERMTIDWKPNTAKPYLKYRRPPLCRGNFPNAPDDGATFGAVGLLAAIGEWAKLAPHRVKAFNVLDSLQDCAIYLVSYDNTRVTRFNHHVVDLAKRGELGAIVDRFARTAQLWADSEKPYPDRNNKSFQSTYLLFHRAFAQFLERFTAETFRDFFAFRAEYPAQLHLVFEEFFMQIKSIPRPCIEAASRLGQHLNYVAYFVAKSDDKDATRKEKSKILVELETGIMSARNAPELFANLSQRAGRFTQSELPVETKVLMDAAMHEEISLPDTKHLIIAYMRLRSAKQMKEDPQSAELSFDADDEAFSAEDTQTN